MFSGIVFCEPFVFCAAGVKFLSVRQMEIYMTQEAPAHASPAHNAWIAVQISAFVIPFYAGISE